MIRRTSVRESYQTCDQDTELLFLLLLLLILVVQDGLKDVIERRAVTRASRSVMRENTHHRKHLPTSSSLSGSNVRHSELIHFRSSIEASAVTIRRIEFNIANGSRPINDVRCRKHNDSTNSFLLLLLLLGTGYNVGSLSKFLLIITLSLLHRARNVSLLPKQHCGCN